jgi:four helix bundle suffix protein
MSQADTTGIIPRHGGFHNLKSFQVAQLVYDITVRFCDKHVSGRSRTHDQMVQAARSGVQNIAEGSMVSATSRKMEMKLTGVARASLTELRQDYEDFLRQKRMPQWGSRDVRRQLLIDRRPRTADDVAHWIMETHGRGKPYGLGGQSGQGGQSGPPPAMPPPLLPGVPPSSTVSTSSTADIQRAIYAAASANAAIVLIAVAVSLLARQLAAQAATFERDGGFTERLYRTRRARREGPPTPD